MRRYILENIIWLDKMLVNLKQAKYIILSAKSHFYKDKIIIINYCCNKKG